MVYKENNLKDSDGNMYVTVDSLINIINITTDSNIAAVKKVNVKPCRSVKIYIVKDLIKDKIYQVINHVNEKKSIAVKFYLILLSKIHPFYGGNGRTSRMLFISDVEITKLIYETKN